MFGRDTFGDTSFSPGFIPGSSRFTPGADRRSPPHRGPHATGPSIQQVSQQLIRDIQKPSANVGQLVLDAYSSLLRTDVSLEAQLGNITHLSNTLEYHFLNLKNGPHKTTLAQALRDAYTMTADKLLQPPRVADAEAAHRSSSAHQHRRNSEPSPIPAVAFSGRRLDLVSTKATSARGLHGSAASIDFRTPFFHQTTIGRLAFSKHHVAASHTSSTPTFSPSFLTPDMVGAPGSTHGPRQQSIAVSQALWPNGILIQCISPGSTDNLNLHNLQTFISKCHFDTSQGENPAQNDVVKYLAQQQLDYIFGTAPLSAPDTTHTATLIADALPARLAAHFKSVSATTVPFAVLGTIPRGEIFDTAICRGIAQHLATVTTVDDALLFINKGINNSGINTAWGPQNLKLLVDAIPAHLLPALLTPPAAAATSATPTPLETFQTHLRDKPALQLAVNNRITQLAHQAYTAQVRQAVLAEVTVPDGVAGRIPDALRLNGKASILHLQPYLHSIQPTSPQDQALCREVDAFIKAAIDGSPKGKLDLYRHIAALKPSRDPAMALRLNILQGFLNAITQAPTPKLHTLHAPLSGLITVKTAGKSSHQLALAAAAKAGTPIPNPPTTIGQWLDFLHYDYAAKAQKNEDLLASAPATGAGALTKETRNQHTELVKQAKLFGTEIDAVKAHLDKKDTFAARSALQKGISRLSDEIKTLMAAQDALGEGAKAVSIKRLGMLSEQITICQKLDKAIAAVETRYSAPPTATTLTLPTVLPTVITTITVPPLGRIVPAAKNLSSKQLALAEYLNLSPTPSGLPQTVGEYAKFLPLHANARYTKIIAKFQAGSSERTSLDQAIGIYRAGFAPFQEIPSASSMTPTPSIFRTNTPAAIQTLQQQIAQLGMVATTANTKPIVAELIDMLSQLLIAARTAYFETLSPEKALEESAKLLQPTPLKFADIKRLSYESSHTTGNERRQILDMITGLCSSDDITRHVLRAAQRVKALPVAAPPQGMAVVGDLRGKLWDIVDPSATRAPALADPRTGALATPPQQVFDLRFPYAEKNLIRDGLRLPDPPTVGPTPALAKRSDNTIALLLAIMYGNSTPENTALLGAIQTNDLQPFYAAVLALDPHSFMGRQLADIRGLADALTADSGNTAKRAALQASLSEFHHVFTAQPSTSTTTALSLADRYAQRAAIEGYMYPPPTQPRAIPGNPAAERLLKEGLLNQQASGWASASPWVPIVPGKTLSQGRIMELSRASYYPVDVSIMTSICEALEQGIDHVGGSLDLISLGRYVTWWAEILIQQPWDLVTAKDNTDRFALMRRAYLAAYRLNEAYQNQTTTQILRGALSALEVGIQSGLGVAGIQGTPVANHIAPQILNIKQAADPRAAFYACISAASK